MGHWRTSLTDKQIIVLSRDRQRISTWRYTLETPVGSRLQPQTNELSVAPPLHFTNSPVGSRLQLLINTVYGMRCWWSSILVSPFKLTVCGVTSATLGSPSNKNPISLLVARGSSAQLVAARLRSMEDGSRSMEDGSPTLSSCMKHAVGGRPSSV